MLKIETVEELKDVLFRIKSNGKSIGFVPTMGALHEGHISLIKKAREENEVVVCSIFVNPIQFNNASDLEKYPRDLSGDLTLIEKYTDIVFTPTVNEVFPEPPLEKYDFGVLESVMEGNSRPGHFNGVAIIVKRLLDWIKPDKAYFGEKDFQQLIIIRQMVKDLQIQTQIIACPIMREPNGLAMSSRNARLSEEEFEKAAAINRILQDSLMIQPRNPEQIKKYVVTQIERIPEFRLDYFEIVEDTTLQPVENFENDEGIIGCIAVFVRDVRLIDNIRYK